MALRHVAIVVAGVMSLGVFLLPTSYIAAPDWDVLVVDKAGTPQRAMTVRCSSRNYSVETDAHEENATTDSNSYAHFAKRESYVLVIGLIFGVLHSATGGIHASFGPHAHVFAFGNGKDGIAVSDSYVLDWTGAPGHMNSRIVVAERN